MANLSDDTIHKILQQIQSSHIASQKSLASVSAQIQVKTREKRVLDLTVQQLESIPGVTGAAGGEGDGEGEVGMYKIVGKMFLSLPPSTILSTSHSQQKSLSEDLLSLTKKAKYLEKEVRDVEGQWRDLMEGMKRSGG